MQIAQNINKVDILTILEMPYIGELHSYTLHGTQSLSINKTTRNFQIPQKHF